MRIGLPISESKTQYYINQAYVEYIEAAGFEPVLIHTRANIDVITKSLDGLILPGGIDVDPIYYGMDNVSSYTVDPAKDQFERNLFHSCRLKNLPVFGICRGLQLISLEYLVAHPEANSHLDFWTHIGSHNQVESLKLEREYCVHFVSASANLLYGSTEVSRKPIRIPVNSMHHQALVAKKAEHPVGQKFAMVAWTERGLVEKEAKASVVVEAFSITGWGGKILAVQWHPEELKDHRLISNFFSGQQKKVIANAV